MGTSAQGERAQTGPSLRHTSLLPFAPRPGACTWALLPFSLLSPIPFGVKHPPGDDGAASPWGSPGQASPVHCARRSQGSCLHRGHGYLSLKPWDSLPELSPTREQGRGCGPELLHSCINSPGGCAPASPAPRARHPGPSHPAPQISRSTPRIPCTSDPLHSRSPAPWIPSTLDRQHSGSPALQAP